MMQKRPRLILQPILLIALITTVASLSLGQTAPNKKAPATPVISIAKPKPDPAAFDKYDDWFEAIVNWMIDQRLTPTEKQVILNAAPAPGRYQIVSNPHARADTFMLDTQTGRVWQLVSYINVEGDPIVWQAVPRIDNDEELASWSAKQTKKQK